MGLIIICAIIVCAIIVCATPSPTSREEKRKAIEKDYEKKDLELCRKEWAEYEKLIDDMVHDVSLLMTTYTSRIPSIKSEIQTLQVTNEERLAYYKKLDQKITEAYNYLKDIKITYGIDYDYIEKEFRYLIPPGYIEKLTYRLKKQEEQFSTKDLYDFIETTKQQYEKIVMDYIATKRGIEGEEYVNRVLNDYYDIINLENIRLEVKDQQGKIQSVENDNILITRQGIFILEVKNYGSSGSYDLIIERDGRWAKRFRNGKIEPMSNATGQNNRHVNYVSKFINTELKQNFDSPIPVYGVVIIPNDTILIDNQDPLQSVYRASQIHQFVTSKDIVLTNEKMKQIETLIKIHQLPPKTYPLTDQVNVLIERIQIIQQQQLHYETWLNKINEQILKYTYRLKLLKRGRQIRYNRMLDTLPKEIEKERYIITLEKKPVLSLQEILNQDV